MYLPPMEDLDVCCMLGGKFRTPQFETIFVSFVLYFSLPGHEVLGKLL